MYSPKHALKAAALVVSFSLSACLSPTLGNTAEPHRGDVVEDAGTQSPDASPSCSTDPGAVLLSGLAQADSDETTPGPPAVATDGEKFLVVVPRVAPGYSEDALVAALVAKDRTVLKTRTIIEGKPRGIALAFDGSGYLLVVSSQHGVLQGVRLSADGQTAGALFQIASGVVPLSVDSLALGFGGGTYLVVYRRSTGTYQEDVHLFARRVSPAGNVSEEITISDVHGGQGSPAIAYDGTRFLVVWQDGRNGTYEDGTDIYAARVDSDGTVLDSSGIAVCTSPGSQQQPHAAFDGSRFVVVWFDSTDPHLFGAGNIRGARLDMDGVLLDGPSSAGGFSINSGPNMKDHPHVLRFGQGSLVTWGTPGYPGNGGAGIFGAHLGADGRLLDDAKGEEGLLMSGVPACGRYFFPMTSAIGDHGLMAWLASCDPASQMKAVLVSSLCPF